MTQTKTYHNDRTGYTVTLVDNGRGYAEVSDSLNYRFPMVGADYPHAATLAKGRAGINGAVEVPAVPAPAQIVSPLAPVAQVAPSNLAAGATLTMPTLPQARCLDWAATAHGGIVRRGVASHTGHTAPLPVLVAMVRRGWFEWPAGLKMQAVKVTGTGMRALAAYVARNGEVR